MPIPKFPEIKNNKHRLSLVSSMTMSRKLAVSIAGVLTALSFIFVKVNIEKLVASPSHDTSPTSIFFLLLIVIGWVVFYLYSHPQGQATNPQPTNTDNSPLPSQETPQAKKFMTAIVSGFQQFLTLEIIFYVVVLVVLLLFVFLRT